MKRLVILTIAAIIAIFSTHFVAEGANVKLNTFKNLTAYKAGDEFRLVLSFDGKPKSAVKYFEKSIQIDVADAQVNPARKIFDVSNAGIDEIKIYQFDPKTVRIRILPVDGDAASLKNRINFSVKDGKLTAKLSPNKPIPPPISPTIALNNGEASAKPALPHETQKVTQKARLPEPKSGIGDIPVIAKETAKVEKPKVEIGNEGRGDDKMASLNSYLKNMNEEGGLETSANIPSVSLNMGTDNKKTNNSAIPSLGEAVVKVGSALAIVLALVLLVSFGARKYLNAMEGSLGSKKQVKVLSSHHIGVKKNVTIIEVAGEILVLGVANESINLLARYTDEDKIEELRFAHRLPDRPNGMFKKLPFLSGIKKVKQKINPAFANKVASYIETMKTKTMAKMESGKEETATANDRISKDEMVSNVTASIAARLRAMNGATA